jgi:hypothetical protein
MRWIFLAAYIGLLIGLSGCTSMVDFENSQVIDSTPLGFLSPDDHLGQTILVRRTPLTGIKLHLRLSEAAQDLDSHLLFRLYSSLDRSENYYIGQVNYRQIQYNFPIVISIPALALESGQYVYLELESTGSPVWVYGREEDNYANGQLYVDGQPQNGDLAFSLTYEYGLAAAGEDLINILRQSWLLLPLFGLLLLPGWILLEVAGLNHRYQLPEKIGLALGISLALPALVFTWAGSVGQSLPSGLITSVYVLLAISAVAIVGYRYLLRQRTGQHTTRPPDNPSMFNRPALVGIAVICLFGLVLFIRLAMVRDMSGPAWVDPVHHTLITRLIQETGRIPADFTPYATAPATNYHTGFHVSAAIFAWLSGLEAIDSLFVLGQVLNAAAVIAVYLLAYELTGSRLVGLLAALIAGFASPMPAYYTSWGRYTQLTGLIILPAGFVLLRKIYRPDPSDPDDSALGRETASRRRFIWLAALTCSGLFFIHYRVAVFLLCLVLADVLIQWIASPHARDPEKPLKIIGLLKTAGLTLLMTLPVLIPVVLDLLPRRAVQWNQPGAVAAFSIPWGFLTAAMGVPMLIAAALGLIAALFRQTRLAVISILWIALMFLAANLNRLGLPTGGLISNDSVIISLFFPLSILGAFFLASLWALVSRHGMVWKWIIALSLAIIAAYTIVVGSQKLLTIINPTTVFLRNGDRTAARWITENLPEQAGFLVNPAPWGYGIYVGSDGGYWLSPLSGQLTFPPTLLYGHGYRPDIAEINQAARQVLENAQDADFLAGFMREKKLEYLYLGVRGGPIDSRVLLQSAQFELIYHQEGAWIFRLAGQADR